MKLILYWTFSVKLAECLSEPLLAVTTTVYLPKGVPGSGGGLLLLPLPPPQAVKVSNPKTTSDSRVLALRRLEGTFNKRMPARANPLMLAHHASV